MIEKALLEMGNFGQTERELLEITRRMLNAIHTGDAHTYADLCRPELTCFEDVCAYRIDGIEFHTSLIRQMAENPANRPARFDMLTPHVQLYGDTAIVTYTRLMTYDLDGKPTWRTFNETRVFIKEHNKEHSNWKMAHFHRSPT